MDPFLHVRLLFPATRLLAMVAVGFTAMGFAVTIGNLVWRRIAVWSLILSSRAG